MDFGVERIVLRYIIIIIEKQEIRSSPMRMGHGT